MKQFFDIIATLHAHYNILVVYHPSEPENKRVFVVNSFTPVQNNIHFLDVRAKEITDIMSDPSFYTQFALSRQTGISTGEFQVAQFDTKISPIPDRHYQFAPDYTWEWYLSA